MGIKITRVPLVRQDDGRLRVKPLFCLGRVVPVE